jgi:hypothetical protein
MEAKTLQIANIQKDEEFETLPTRIMPVIKEAVGYENSLQEIHSLSKEPREMEVVCPKRASLFLVVPFQNVYGNRSIQEREPSQVVEHTCNPSTREVEA